MFKGHLVHKVEVIYSPAEEVYVRSMVQSSVRPSVDQTS